MHGMRRNKPYAARTSIIFASPLGSSIDLLIVGGADKKSRKKKKVKTYVNPMDAQTTLKLAGSSAALSHNRLVPSATLSSYDAKGAR